MNKFGLYNKFTAVEGKRDALAEMLLEAAKSMEGLDECELYVVSLSDNNKDSIYVYEVWNDENAHRASLSMEASQTLIQKAKPIIAGVEKMNTSSPIGGKGIARA
ncbi:antibiotic biosynthesis monooxygenase [Halomonas sp. MG34]|nr:antibiotic biosynthesis monooxygenase [Halomonas sp. MG34]